MSHVTITTEGAIVYRTKTMTMSRAAAFARMIQSNADRFTSVEIKPAQRTRIASFIVTFQPVSRERQEDLYEQQFNARKDRAEAEGMDYIFWPDPDRTGVTWCYNPNSGETYEVQTFSCSCPDYHYRCEKAGLLCKHQQALTLQREAGVVGKTDKTTPKQQRQAWYAANVNRDF